MGCRRRAPKSELIRLARVPGGPIVVDPDGKAPGRGAYVCSGNKLECFEIAVKRGRVGRALRAKLGTAEVSAIAEALCAEATNEQKRELIG